MIDLFINQNLSLPFKDNLVDICTDGYQFIAELMEDIGKAKGVPNVKLGWWWMGDQVGTALLRHPVFGDLPHDGHLSPLLFRIVGNGKPLDGAGYKEEDLLMVGEGGKFSIGSSPASLP